MLEPTRNQLYAALGVFALLVVVSVFVGGVLSWLIWLLLLALVVYFAVIAARDYRRKRGG